MTLRYDNPSAKAVKICNGVKWTMKRKDSFMVEVEVADDETEDQAVKRYMKAVVQSGVINKLRNRRRKMTKIEAYKLRLQERAQIRKLKIVEPTWEDFYGLEEDSRPFEEYFRYGATYGDGDVFFGSNEPMPNLLTFNTGMDGYTYGAPPFDAYSGFQNQGGYVTAPAEGGYMDQAGFYQQQGGYVDQGYATQEGGYVADQGYYQQGGYVQENAGEEVTFRFDQQ